MYKRDLPQRPDSFHLPDEMSSRVLPTSASGALLSDLSFSFSEWPLQWVFLLHLTAHQSASKLEGYWIRSSFAICALHPSGSLWTHDKNTFSKEWGDRAHKHPRWLAESLLWWTKDRLFSIHRSRVPPRAGCHAFNFFAWVRLVGCFCKDSITQFLWLIELGWLVTLLARDAVPLYGWVTVHHLPGLGDQSINQWGWDWLIKKM